MRKKSEQATKGRGRPRWAASRKPAETERSQAEEALRESEKRYRSLFENMLEGYAYCRMLFDHDEPQDFIYLDVNSAFEKLTGLKDVVGKKVSEVIPRLRDSNPELFKIYGRVALTGKPERFETFLESLGIWFSIAVYSPQKECFVAVFDNITQRKIAEEARRKSEALYHDLVETSQDLIWQCDAEGRYIYLNPAWEQVFGYKVEEMLGKKFSDFQSQEMAARDLKEFARLMNGGSVKGLETVHIGKSGNEIHLVFNAKFVMDEKGNISGRRGTAYDITERKRTEEALRKSEERFRAIASNTPDHILVQDSDLRYSFVVNPQLGLTEADMLGKTDGDILGAEEAKNLTAVKRQVLETGEPFHLEASLQNLKGETEFFDGSYVPKFDSTGKANGLIGYFRNITERKRSEKALQMSEERLKLALEGTNDGLWDVQMATGAVYLSPRGCEILGYQPSELPEIAKVWSDLVHPDDMPATLAALNAYLEGRAPIFQVEQRLRLKTGKWKWILARGKAVERDANGVPVRMIGTHTDISERKRAEEALREKDTLLREMSRMANIGGWEFDPATSEGTWTEEVGRIHEVDPDKGTNVDFGLSFYQGESRQKIEAAVREAVDQGKPYDLELGMVTAAGNRKWIRTIGVPIKIGDRVVKVRGTFQDITERKRADEEIRRHSEEIQILYTGAMQLSKSLDLDHTAGITAGACVETMGASLAWILIAEPDGSLRTLAFYPRHIGYPGKAVIRWDDSPQGRGPTGQAIRERKPIINSDLAAASPTFAPWRASAMEEGFRTSAAIPLISGDKVLGALNIYSRDPDFFTPEKLTLFQTFSGQVSLALENARLFTEIQSYAAELEQRVAERTAQLQAAVKELESFAYSVSHDLKAPLRGIDGYSRLLLEDHADRLNDEGRSFLNSICKAAAQMDELIEDLLAYSQLERRRPDRGRVNPGALAQTLVAERDDEIRARGVAIRVNVDCAAVFADPDGLAQALRNLLDNALKFTRDAPHPAIEIGGRESEGACILWVRDNGIGFDMQYHDRIFDIFQRLHRIEDYSGTGIGLAIVRIAMERMGGRAWAESAPGAGATFYLEIPK